MTWLPLANVLHHKTRSVLSALGIGIGICMLVTLSGLSHGSLFEVAERWESVDADLILYPRGWGSGAAAKSGIGLSDRYAAKIVAENGDIVQRIVPVFSWPMRLAGQDHQAAGIDPCDFAVLSGGRKLREGRLFDPEGAFARWLEGRLLTGGAAEAAPMEMTPSELGAGAHNGLELVIDERLARAGKLQVGQTVEAASHRWTIVGIAPQGVMVRVFLPRRTAQFLFTGGDITKSTLMLIKLKPGVDGPLAARRIQRTTGQDAVPLDAFRGMLVAQFGIMFTYVYIVDVVAMVISFLFVTITLYTMVLQRKREIAILKSCGASNAFILRQVLGESMILTAMGTAMGIAMALAAAAAIEAFRPLLTVSITVEWLGIAAGAAAAGAAVSAVYPAWCAMRVDVTESLTLE
jgi:putative ABC transport system permease protein